MNLIEKLEKSLKHLQDSEKGQYTVGVSDGYELALCDVKNYTDWVSFLGDNKPQHDDCCLFIIKGDCSEYPTVTDVGLVKFYNEKMRVFSLSEPELQLNTSRILAWKRYEYPNNDFIRKLLKIDKNGYSQLPNEENP